MHRCSNAIGRLSGLVVLLPTTLFAQQSNSSSPGEISQAVAVLTSPANVFDKAMACRQLSFLGDESAVPALSGLLSDPKIGTYARAALETNPSQEADTALREAIPRLQGDLLIGVLGSIGVRRDEAAIEAIVQLLGEDTTSVATAAARTLGHIGTPAAAEMLQSSLSTATPAFRPVVANACLICVQRLAADGERDRAVALCDVVQNTDVPEHIRLAATYNAILVLGKDGLPRWVEQLNSGQESQFRLALKAARKLGVSAADEIVAHFQKHPPEHQALLLIALGDVGRRASLPTVIEAAQNGEPAVRIQAIRALAKLGDATVVPVLLEAAIDSNQSVAEAARAAMADLKGDQIDAAVVKMLDSKNSRAAVSAIEITAQRNIHSATPALLRLARSEIAVTRRAAIGALAKTTSFDYLPSLIEFTLETRDSKDATLIQKSCQAACARMPQNACAQTLADAMTNLPPAAAVILLEPLVVVGGTQALQTVVAAAKSSDDVMQNAGTRLLGKWLTADAAPALLDLSKTLPHGKYRIRTLRGYIRIARQLNMTADQRMEVCRNALAIAERDAEKKLVLEVLRRFPTRTGLELANSVLKYPELSGLAQSTIDSITNRLDAADTDPTVPRFARQNMTIQDRMAECRNTLMFTRSADERLQAFETLQQYPSAEGLALAVTLLSHKMYEADASHTIVSIARKVGEKAPEDAQKALRQVLNLTEDAKLKRAAEKQLAVVRDLAARPSANRSP